MDATSNPTTDQTFAHYDDMTPAQTAAADRGECGTSSSRMARPSFAAAR